jgi:hypothetical protein
MMAMTFGESCGVLALVLMVYFGLVATAFYWSKHI